MVTAAGELITADSWQTGLGETAVAHWGVIAWPLEKSWSWVNWQGVVGSKLQLKSQINAEAYPLQP